MESARRRLTRLEALAAAQRLANSGPTAADLLTAADATPDELEAAAYLADAYTPGSDWPDPNAASQAARVLWEAMKRGRDRLQGADAPAG